MIFRPGIVVIALFGYVCLAGIANVFVRSPVHAQGTSEPDTTPPGMVAFFPLSAEEGCPSGWSEYQDDQGNYAARGRFLMPVSNPDDVGKTVGTALGNETSAPTHDHTFQTTVTLDQHGCACTSPGAGFKSATNGSKDAPNNPPGTTAGEAAYSYTQLLVCRKDPPSGTPPADTYAQYSVAFFDQTSCPAGWEMMKSGSTVVSGMFVVPFYNATTNIGAAVGTSITIGQSWAHSHGFASSISFGNSDIVADKGSSLSIAEGNKTYNFSGTTGSTTVDLPYLQLLLCEKTTYTSSTLPAGLPQKILVFFDESACPNGWISSPTGSGRLLLGLPENGTPSQTVGDNFVAAPGKAYTHTHLFSGSIDVGEEQIAEAGGCQSWIGLCNGGHASTGDRSFSGTTDASDSIPYVALNLCQPNT